MQKILKGLIIRFYFYVCCKHYCRHIVMHNVLHLFLRIIHRVHDRRLLIRFFLKYSVRTVFFLGRL